MVRQIHEIGSFSFWLHLQPNSLSAGPTVTATYPQVLQIRVEGEELVLLIPAMAIIMGI